MYVVTFYSFKGGVGRTLALLNVAYETANSGQRVLVVDFDLEAPAIRPDRWKQGANDDETGDVGRGPTDPGVVEFVTRYLETMCVPRVSDYIVDATPEGCRGHLAVMSAGAVDGTYGKRLNAIDWGLLYAARDGYVMFEDVRAQWQAADFDYVLLDSRTGFTDVGGICTRHLPDAVVSLFRPDDQSLGGTAQMAEAIRAEVPTPRRADDIELHFVMAGIPDADDEHGHLARRGKVFVDRLAIPGHDRLMEIRHYSSMDLLTQPIYTIGTAGDQACEIVPCTHAEDSGRERRRPWPPVKTKHFAAITDPKEVGPLLRQLDTYSGTLPVRCALRLAPLVFVRLGELVAAEWAGIDLEGTEWRYTVTKTGRPHVVPLARQAVAILREVHPMTGHHRYVFPNARFPYRELPMSRGTLWSAFRALDIPKERMTMHGFRAMARTILDEVLGFRPDFIEHQLAHAVRDPNGRAYNRTACLPERRVMMQAWADYLDRLRVGEIEPGPVDGKATQSI